MASQVSASPPKPKCRCCPYGFHIDLDFVNFAEEVSKGQQTRSARTPTLPRRSATSAASLHYPERTLTSPLESIFSDSLENIVSDFEEVLDRQNFLDFEPIPKTSNGYCSDYTGYRTKSAGAGSVAESRFHNGNSRRADTSTLDEFLVPPKPLNRPSMNGGVRAHIQRSNSAYTALGRTLSEIKARQSMETLLEQSPTPSRIGTPLDLGLSTVTRHSARSEQHEHSSLSSPKSEGPSWRRPSQPSALGAPTSLPPPVPQRSPGTPVDSASISDVSQFASMRRGREPQAIDTEHQTTRVRYYSASPKVSRRFAAAPPLKQNGSDWHAGEQIISQQEVLSCLQPPKPPKRDTKSVGVTTGPLPPAKPCITCPTLKTQLDELTAKISKPVTTSSYTLTDPPEVKITKDSCVGEKLQMLTVGVHTDRVETKETDTQSTVAEQKEAEAQATTEQASVAIGFHPILISFGTNTECEEKREITDSAVNTEPEFVPAEPSAPEPALEFVDGFCNTENVERKDTGSLASVDTSTRETMTIRVEHRTFESQTTTSEMRDTASSPISHLLDEYIRILQEEEQIKKELSAASTAPSSSNHAEVQTDPIEYGEGSSSYDHSEPRMLADELSDSVELLLQRKFETVDVSVGPDTAPDTVSEPPTDYETASVCEECEKRVNIFTRHVGVGACSVSDKVCATCDKDMEVVDENEVPGFCPKQESEKGELTRADATKKLLQQKHTFVRGSAVSRSCRLEKEHRGDSLEYIEERHKTQPGQKEHSPTPATTPSADVAEALTTKVVLKKEVPPPSSSLPDPVPARIPRPKYSKYAPHNESAENADEESEVADRLTPLRSELRSLGGRWSPHCASTPRDTFRHSYSEPHSFKISSCWAEHSDLDEEDEDILSDGSEGAYDCQEDAVEDVPSYEISVPFREALDSLNSHLQNMGSVSAETADWALKYVQHEWMRLAAKKNSVAAHVQLLLDQLKEMGTVMLQTVVNLSDQNGNSALHYAVSHGNFAVVSCLLDCGICNLNLANKAGYTPVMLAALSSLETEVEKAVVHRLFEMGDVNARATQHGQTALMLAVSHGKINTAQLLIDTNADVNIQDEEGSTALMCAAEHGHRALVKLLLSHPHIDASIADCDSSTALSIAVENGHRDIGVLIYAHLNYSKKETVDDV